MSTEPLWLPSLDDLAFFTPDIVLTVTMVAIMLASMILGRRVGVCTVTAVGGLIAMFFCNIDVASRLAETGGRGLLEPTLDAPMLIADNFTVFFKFMLIIFMVAVVGLWLMGAGRRTADPPEFFILMLGSALGMSLMVSTLNLLVVIMAIELASMPSYALVAFDKKSRLGAEGSMKYVIFGSASAAIMLYGATLLYGLFGTLNIADMAPMLLQSLNAGTNVPLISVALFAFAGGILFKISAVPFHFWCPDAFQGAQVEVTTWLSVVSKAAGLCLLFRILNTLAASAGGAVDAMQPITMTIGVLAAITCLVGNLAAYRQRSVKRMLAYSSIAHAGYMMMFGAIVLRAEVSEGAWTAVIIYLVMYLFMNLGAFGATAVVAWETGGDDIENFNGLGRRALVLAVSMSLCLFSLIGMPPLGGFIGKWFLLVALADGGDAWLWMLIIWASLNTLFSLFYYMRVVKHMFLIDDGRDRLTAPIPAVFMVTTSAVVLVLAGTLMVSPLRDGAKQYASSLFVAPAYAAAPAAPADATIADAHGEPQP